MNQRVGIFRLSLLIAVVVSAFALTGCLSSSTAIHYTSPAPPEKTCTLNIAATFTVKKFDGQPVDWSSGFANWSKVQIAEGSHTFVLDYQNSMKAGRQYTLNGMVLTYDRFVAGHTYLLAADADLAGASSSSMGIRVGIKDVTNDPDWASLSNAFSWQEGFEWLPVTLSK